MAKNTDINAADTALLYARADLARIVVFTSTAQSINSNPKKVICS
jgi:hypothetical protein